NGRCSDCPGRYHSGTGRSLPQSARRNRHLRAGHVDGSDRDLHSSQRKTTRNSRLALVQAVSEHYFLEHREHCNVLHLLSSDGLTRLARERMLNLIEAVSELHADAARRAPAGKNASKPLIIVGNRHYFSVGADLNEIASLNAVEGLEFAKVGQ